MNKSCSSINFIRKVCIMLRYHNNTVGNLKLTLQRTRRICNKETLFFTRNTAAKVYYERRCPFMGSCIEDKCRTLQPNDSIPELHEAEKFPGYSMCTSTCTGLTCGCLTPFPADAYPGCLFYRVAQVPQNDEVYHIFKCSSWNPEIHLTLETTHKEIAAKRVFATTSLCFKEKAQQSQSPSFIAKCYSTTTLLAIMPKLPAAVPDPTNKEDAPADTPGLAAANHPDTFEVSTRLTLNLLKFDIQEIKNSVSPRKSFRLRDLNKCISCLAPAHGQCSNKCRSCGGTHHVILCAERTKQGPSHKRPKLEH
ncbi:hypothetical protein COOONC_25504 [Cooperia oncophora]